MFGYLSADEEGGCGGAESIVPMDADPDITYIDADGEKYVWLGDPEDAPDSIEI